MARDTSINKNEYTVYCHTTPSGKKYIGMSKDPVKRWNQGKGYIKNLIFFRAIQKYGWDNIRHEILFSGLSAEDAKEKERSLIEEYNTRDVRYGYNLREGGDGTFSKESRHLMSIHRMGNKNSLGYIPSEETKMKISQSLKDYYKDRPGSFSNRHHTTETIQKLKDRTISEDSKNKMKGHRDSISGERNPSARPVRQLSNDGSVVKEYVYATLAAKEVGADLSNIIKCCRGKIKTCMGFRWEYAG